MQRSPPHRRSIGSLYVGFVLTGIVNTMLGPLLPWLTERWQLSDVAAGSLFTIQFAGGLAGGAVSGALAARYGTGTILATGHTLMAGGLASVAGGSYLVGAIGIAVAGLGLGLVIPTTNLMSARLSPHRPAAALGAVNLCWGLGAAIWPLIVTAVTARAALGSALVGVGILLAAMALAVSRVPFPGDDVHVESGSESRSPNLARLAMFGACVALYSGSEAAFGGWITEYTRRVAQAGSAVRWEAAASAFWGGVTAGRAAAAIFLVRRMEGPALFAGLGVVFTSIALVLIVPHPLVILPLCAICGLGFAPVFPVTVAALAQEFPARFAGPMVALGSAGAALLPWLVGVVSARTGSLTVGLATLLVSVMTLLVLHAMRVASWPARRQSAQA